MPDDKKQTVDATLSGKLETSHIEITPAAPAPVAAPPAVSGNGLASLERFLRDQMDEINKQLDGLRKILEGDGQAGGLKTTVLLMAQKLDASIARFDGSMGNRRDAWKMGVGLVLGAALAFAGSLLIDYVRG